MQSIMFDSTTTGIVSFSGETKTVVVHYTDKTTTMSVVEFLTLRNKKGIKRIDCYKEGEEINE